MEADIKGGSAYQRDSRGTLSKVFKKLICSFWKKNRRGKGGVRRVMKEICEESGKRETELQGGGEEGKYRG
jgi:hypothetical protein